MALKFQQTFIRPPLRGYLLKELIKVSPSGSKPTLCKTVLKRPPPLLCYQDLSSSLACLNINSIQTPSYIDPAKTRIPPPLPLPLSRVIQLPHIQKDVTYEDQAPTKTVEDPYPSTVYEKQAARLIVIRKKKMKKHKLKKLRKRMKFEFAKIRQRRELKKEKLFQAGLIEKMKEAVAFDPAKYAAEKIAKSKEVELPQVWYGVKYPDYIIKQLMEEQEMKAKEKADDEKRRASMSPYVKDYLDKLPK